MKVIGVRFKSSGRIYYFDPLDYEFNEGDGVIVETARGQEFGEVAQAAVEVEDTMIVAPLKPVVRPATAQDSAMREQNSAKEGDAFRICQQKILQHELDMHLVSAEYSFNGSKLIFYFTADERVDFRELVKDLAAQFRTRIELRQIGVRDEAKMLGGLGACGRPVCCKTFLRDFHPVSIKMAKEQNLSLSPTKISGLCGRLMCCLQYEQAVYEEMKRKMPRVNREIQTPDGVGMVVDNNIITEKTKVRLTLPDGTIEVREFHYSMLAKPGDPLPVPKVEPKTETVSETSDDKNEAAQKPTTEKKRRRRGGRGRSGNRGNGGGTQVDAKSGGDNAQKQQSGNQNQRSQRPKQPQNAAKRPQKERGGAQQQKQSGGTGGNSGAKSGGNYKRRRGGANRPKNGSPQAGKPEQNG
jgi:cell fate regulator YaaT (PSP1 superfamily)